MTERYYHEEHFTAYAQIRREGLAQWNDLHGDTGGYDDFQNREFLTSVLPQNGGGRRVLEYGCGTGPAACFLAARGFRVDAVDLVPDAIEVAREKASERGLKINFSVADVCRWGPSTERYDYVIDSYCLQSIVTDEDRSAVLNGVRDRLEHSGSYLVSTVLYSPDRDYGDDHYDSSSGIVWTVTDDERLDTTMIEGKLYRPHRRHLTLDALELELAGHGFRITDHDAQHFDGDIVAQRADT